MSNQCANFNFHPFLKVYNPIILTYSINLDTWMEDTQSNWCCIFVNPILQRSKLYNCNYSKKFSSLIFPTFIQSKFTYHVVDIEDNWLTRHLWDKFFAILRITQTTGKRQITAKTWRKHHRDTWYLNCRWTSALSTYSRAPNKHNTLSSFTCPK